MFLDLIALVLLGGCYLKEIEMPRASSRGGAVAGPPSGAQDDVVPKLHLHFQEFITTASLLLGTNFCLSLFRQLQQNITD